MEQLVVVAYPEPLAIEARKIQNEALPEGSIALGYYHQDKLIARSLVEPDAMEAIDAILSTPVSVALAATEDEDEGGGINARVCLVLPVDPDQLGQQGGQQPDEPWKSSVPTPPPEIEQSYSGGGAAPAGAGAGGDDEERPHVALFPIGNVVRNAQDRNHPDDVTGDAREMLQNLLSGNAKGATAKAIDDLLDSI